MLIDLSHWASRLNGLSQKAVAASVQDALAHQASFFGSKRVGIEVRVLNICGQAIKGTWGMSWRQKAMTGVENCEKLGVAVKQVMIPRFPNYCILNT